MCIFRFLIHENKLTISDINLIWDSQIEKHDAIIKNIHDFLAKLAWVLTPTQLDAIFARFKIVLSVALNVTLTEWLGFLSLYVKVAYIFPPEYIWYFYVS